MHVQRIYFPLFSLLIDFCHILSSVSSSLMFGRIVTVMYCLYGTRILCVWYVWVCLSMCASGLPIRALASWPWPSEGHGTVKPCHVYCVSADFWRLRLRKQGERPENETSQSELGLSASTGHPGVDSVCITAGELGEQTFNKALLTCCKWRMIRKTTETLADHTHPAWAVMHRSAVKTNILCSKWAFCPSGSLVSTFYTCISSSHCGQSHHMLRSVIIAECLQSSHINTCVKQHGVPSCPSFYFPPGKNTK